MGCLVPLTTLEGGGEGGGVAGGSSPSVSYEQILGRKGISTDRLVEIP